MTENKSGDHAVVIGAGMAGLLSAHVLARHYARVTVIERDRLPDRAAHRPGVPQTHHVHNLLVAGYRLLNELLPGLDADLAAAGAPEVDWMADAAILFPDGWLPRVPSELRTRPASRDLLEWSVRRRVCGHPAIAIADGRRVIGLLASRDRRTVEGVRVTGESPKAHGHADDEIRADLVVDASGRTSRAADWLAALGYPRPRETIIDSHSGYASRWYRASRGFDGDWKAILLSYKAPDHARAGVLIPVENGSCVLTLAGAGRDYPPTDETAFLDFARSLRSPILYEAVRAAEPISPIYGYRALENRARHFHRIRALPGGFVITGDAVCAFNPVYGQGMTVAALGATALDRSLQRRRDDQDGGKLDVDFQRSFARAYGGAWLMASGEDYRWPQTVGPPMRPITRIMHRYIDGVLAAAVQDAAVARAFSRVWHMLDAPNSLLKPGIVSRVARAHVRRRPQPQRHAPPDG